MLLKRSSLGGHLTQSFHHWHHLSYLMLFPSSHRSLLDFWDKTLDSLPISLLYLVPFAIPCPLPDPSMLEWPPGSFLFSLLCILTLMGVSFCLRTVNAIFLLTTAKFLSPALELQSQASICLMYISTWVTSYVSPTKYVWNQISHFLPLPYASPSRWMVSPSFWLIGWNEPWSHPENFPFLTVHTSSIRKSCCLCLQNISGLLLTTSTGLPSLNHHCLLPA